MPLDPRGRPPALDSPGPSPLLKSVLDRVLALLLLVCAAPWLALAALVLWCADDGPLLDREARVGLWGRRFHLLRLRTVLPLGHHSSPVRALVRRTCLDELLQLVNVLRGDMALVGPRALTPAEADRRPPDIRLLLRPGMVDLRHLTDGPLADEATVAERYARDWSPLLDLRILVRALGRTVRR
ncbi:sugar transferase [Geodermatophilus sp. SYSU D01106]